MTRGFATIATGDLHFYEIAHNLLFSYWFHCPDPMPFAIICDRENSYTADFDRVVALENPTCSYVDKLALPDLAPFDETIFIDADSLAYGNLNDLWDAFDGESAFSAFGDDYPPDYPYAWFALDGAGGYRDAVASIPDFIGGVYYLRTCDELEGFSRTCRHILEHYHEFTFRQFTDPADEPVYALAMAAHGFRTAGDRSLPICFYPHARHFDADIVSGHVAYDSVYLQDAGLAQGAYLVHWGSGNTGRPCYLFQKRLLDDALAGKGRGYVRQAAAKAGVYMSWALSKLRSLRPRRHFGSFQVK